MLTNNKEVWKAVPLGRLRTLLADLPDDTLLSVNRVGNLLVLDREERPLGYVDLADESYAALGDEERPPPHRRVLSERERNLILLLVCGAVAFFPYTCSKPEDPVVRDLKVLQRNR